MDRLSQVAVQRVKQEIQKSSQHILEYTENNPSTIIIQRTYETEIQCILKKVIFLKRLNFSVNFDELFSQIISDLLSIAKYLVSDDLRGYALTQRSILENLIRVIMGRVASTDHVTLNLLNEFQEATRPALTDDDWSLIMDIYNTSSTIVHFHNNCDTLNSYVMDCFPLSIKDANYVKHISDSAVKKWRNLFSILEKLLCTKYPEEIFGSFSRQRVLLKYLVFDTSFGVLQQTKDPSSSK